MFAITHAADNIYKVPIKSSLQVFQSNLGFQKHDILMDNTVQ